VLRKNPYSPFQAEPFQALNEGFSNIQIALEPLVMGNSVQIPQKGSLTLYNVDSSFMRVKI
jgi:hypothetical protein